MRSIAHLDTDIMLEAKAKDLALLRLRNDLARYDPALARRYNVEVADAAEDAGEIVLEAAEETE